jgi:hypothetical protein
MATAGRSFKTNFGQEVASNSLISEMNSPANLQQKQTRGTITDIRMPGEAQPREGSGILIQIAFDDSNYQSATWFPLMGDYSQISSSLGNREAIIKAKPRVMITFPITRITDGYATLICDNTEEEKYQNHLKNRSNSFINIISGLAFNTKCPG